MSRVLVTGIDGFTGRYVARTLVARGHEVIGMSRDGSGPHDAPVAATFHADLADLAALTAMMRDSRPDRIVHLAAISAVTHGDIAAIYQTNVVGSHNLLQSIVDANVQPDAVLLASSATIYGNASEGKIEESAALVPVNDYGVSKMAVEHIGRIYGDQMPITIVRPFNYTGVGQSANFIIPKMVDHARRGETRLIMGDLNIARDFSDVRTVADCYARLLDAPDAAGKTFNICSGRPYILRDVLKIIEQLSGMRFDIGINPEFMRKTDLMTLFGSRALPGTDDRSDRDAIARGDAAMDAAGLGRGHLRVAFSVDALTPNLTGIGRYCWELTKRLPHDRRVATLSFFRGTEWFSDPTILLHGNGERPRRRSEELRKRWGQMAAARSVQ